MKQKVIKGITLLVFASFIGTFVWYNVQKAEKRTVRPEIHKTIVQPNSVSTDSLPALAADGTETETLKPVKKKKVAPVSEIEEKYIDLSGDSAYEEEFVPMMGGSKSAIITEPIRMMGGSKSIIMVEPKFEFDLPNPHAKKKKK